MFFAQKFASRPLARVSWRQLFRHPWQTALMILGITLGVAVVVAIDLANASASRAFDLSTEAVTGRATHQITGGPLGLADSVFAQISTSRREFKVAPVVTQFVSSPQLGQVPLQLLGVDPFSEPPFRSYLSNPGKRLSASNSASLVTFLTRPGAIMISADVSRQFGVENGEIIQLNINGQIKEATIAGILESGDDLNRQALEDLLIADIATAQELTGRIGRIDRIDLILSPSAQEAQLRQIRAVLPADAYVSPVAARKGAIEGMTEAFRVNLNALSLLALVVGLFLIYNTITFSVVQRRPLFGTLRCLGVTPEEIFSMVVLEAFIVGLIGAAAGILVGVVLGQSALRLVTQTINDLYFVTTVRGVQVPLSSLAKGGLLGVFATTIIAAPPAWEAATVVPRLALSRSGLEGKAGRAVLPAAVLGVLLLLAGTGVLLLPTRDLVVSFAGTFAVVIGFALLSPVATVAIMRLTTPLAGALWGSLGKMAPRDVNKSLSRTSIAIAALMVAVSVTIGVSLMISSFRHTVILWLKQTLQGDIYISVPSPVSSTRSIPIQPAALGVIQSWPQIAEVYTLRSVEIESPQGQVHINASSNANVSRERNYLAADIPVSEMPARMQQGAVIVSEPLARRLGLPLHGGKITLFTDRGPKEFHVAGIYYDYSSSQGSATMAMDVYRQNWQDAEITAVALHVQPGTDIEGTARRLKGALAAKQQLLVRSNAALRGDVLEVFDRTFAITRALQFLATVVAFIGVLSALLSLELERLHELGILRAIGMTTRQLWGLILLETGLMGGSAGLLSLPAGFSLALILIYIINRRSFGWTIQLQIIPQPFVQALVVALGAALLAGIYPAFRTAKMLAAEAIRNE